MSEIDKSDCKNEKLSIEGYCQEHEKDQLYNEGNIANHVSDNGFIFWIYENLQIKSKKQSK